MQEICPMSSNYYETVLLKQDPGKTPEDHKVLKCTHLTLSRKSTLAATCDFEQSGILT